MVHILTHNDLDGYAAGYVVLEHFGKENCDITHLNYDKEPSIENYKEGDIVVITDYSLSNDSYREILSAIGNEGKLIWCDHHISAIKRYEEEPDICLEGIRSIKYCGAALVWCYFNDLDHHDIDTLPYEQLIEKLPKYLRLVDAWDTWKLDSKYRKDAEALNIAVNSRLSIDLISEVKDFLSDYVEIGNKYIEFRDQWSKQFRDRYMFKKTVRGEQFGANRMVSIAVMSMGCANSSYFGEEIDNCDVCVTQCFNGKGWSYSFYSNKPDIDCSIYANTLGGGGHKGAAGCYIEQLIPLYYID